MAYRSGITHIAFAETIFDIIIVPILPPTKIGIDHFRTAFTERQSRIKAFIDDKPKCAFDECIYNEVVAMLIKHGHLTMRQ